MERVISHLYSLFTLWKPHAPLIFDGERGFLEWPGYINCELFSVSNHWNQHYIILIFAVIMHFQWLADEFSPGNVSVVAPFVWLWHTNEVGSILLNETSLAWMLANRTIVGWCHNARAQTYPKDTDCCLRYKRKNCNIILDVFIAETVISFVGNILHNILDVPV